MSEEVEPTINKFMDQAFAKESERFNHASRRMTETNDFVNQQSQMMFLQESQKIGTREASAMQRMDNDKLASSILQQRSASDQPQTTGSKVQPTVVVEKKT